MRVLVACEFSGRVRDAFLKLGHDAWSCDLLPTESPGPHIQGCVLQNLGLGWDLMIAHPPCTYLCSMGVWWNHKRPERIALMEEALGFVHALMNAPIPRICIENPVGCISTKIRKPDQVINPWQFGDEAHKPTCLWLKDLPLLVPTDIVSRGEFYTKRNGKKTSVWSHKCSGTNKAERAKIASRTFKGIAAAMATQWGVECQQEQFRFRELMLPFE